jgi:fructosamine-3-kinase
MPTSPVEQLTRRVRRYFKTHAARYGLNPHTVSVRYLLNWGGFVNASFHISDGEHALHLKLTDYEDSLACLERWLGVHTLLEERYHAPHLLAWVELAEGDYAGLLFEHLPARTASFSAEPGLHGEVLALASALHADHELAVSLAADQPIPICADSLLETYVDRFDEDLMAVIADLPPFVSLATFDWMMSETRQLEALAHELEVFRQPAGAPLHGDLWEQNVLVGEDGRWYVVDWDDLTLGDPALEFGILLGPLLAHLPLAEREPLPAAIAAVLPEDPALRERFAIYLRAYLLDEVIDSLADYVESAFAPEHQAEVQAEKQRVHEQALRLYQAYYPE